MAQGEDSRFVEQPHRPSNSPQMKHRITVAHEACRPRSQGCTNPTALLSVLPPPPLPLNVAALDAGASVRGAPRQEGKGHSGTCEIVASTRGTYARRSREMTTSAGARGATTPPMRSAPGGHIGRARPVCCAARHGAQPVSTRRLLSRQLGIANGSWSTARVVPLCTLATTHTVCVCVAWVGVGAELWWFGLLTVMQACA